MTIERALDEVDTALTALVSALATTPPPDMEPVGYLTPRHDGQLVYSRAPLCDESYVAYRMRPGAILSTTTRKA